MANNLALRMLSYRSRNRLSQGKLAERMDEDLMTIYRIENGKHKPHKINEIRLTEKMDKLEAEERGKA